MSKLDKTVSEIRRILTLCGFTEDGYGHFHKLATVKNHIGVLISVKIRVKMQKTSCRVEKQTTMSDGSKEWLRVGGEYFSNCQINGNSVTIGRITFKPENADA